MTIVFEASALSSSRHLEGMDLEPQLSALAARWNHLESHFKLLRHMKTHTFLTQYYWCSPYLSFSCYKLNQRNLSFLYYSCSSGIQLLKCHVLSFGFHMCVTRQQRVLEIPILQELIYYYKTSRAQVVHIHTFYSQCS